MKQLIICLSFLALLIACKKENPLYNGKVTLVFSHKVDTSVLVTNVLKYENAAGNVYEIDDLKYFISDVTLYHGGESVIIDNEKAIHYIDISIPATLRWDVYDPIPTGSYDSISFIFGLSETRNLSNIFLNFPEVNMFWPQVLGGGYHYMMMNGKWRKPDNIISSFNFHLGKGQIYSGNTHNTDSIISFVHNCFRVSLPNSSFEIKKDITTDIEIEMNINSWFITPHIYDHNYWGSGIMQNQEALNTAKENGWDVFRVITQ